jgi:2-desacetyl-2-hydroxyethyl bacteriochlorophyllide A dehydrogenase
VTAASGNQGDLDVLERGEDARVRAVEVDRASVRILEDAQTAPLRPGDIRVAVLACGICGTDLHILEGITLPPGSEYPVRPGHEVCGRVTEVGAGADIAIGSLVVLHPLSPCGACADCTGGSEQRCGAARVLGLTTWGGMADAVVWPASRAVVVDGLEPAAAAILADAVATAYRALRLAEVPTGGALCVLGAGGVGTQVIEIARALDPGIRVAAVVRSAGTGARLREQFGDTVTVVVGLGGAVAELRRVVDRFDAVVDFSGAPEAASVGVRILRRGGRLVLGSVDEHPLHLGSMQAFVTREIQVRGSYTSTIDDLRAVTQLALADKLDLASAVTHRFPLAEAESAFATLRQRPPGMVRVVVEP